MRPMGTHCVSQGQSGSDRHIEGERPLSWFRHYKSQLLCCHYSDHSVLECGGSPPLWIERLAG